MSRNPLPSWQWRLYPQGHADPTNLVIHLSTVPLFWLGSLALLATPWLGAVGLAGLAPMALAIGLQGRGHARERVAPVPFRSAWDFVARIVLEQWFTFPRYVVTGGLARALRGEKT